MSEARERIPAWAALARGFLTAALEGLHDDSLEFDTLCNAEFGVMAIRKLYGLDGAVTLDPRDLAEYLEEPKCTCPPELAARGGFRSSCPAEHAR